MSFFSAIRVALAALLVNKGRSVLTSLGIVIGIAAVIAMVSAGGGARYKLDDRLESVGKNLILIKPGIAHSTRHRRGLDSAQEGGCCGYPETSRHLPHGRVGVADDPATGQHAIWQSFHLAGRFYARTRTHSKLEDGATGTFTPRKISNPVPQSVFSAIRCVRNCFHSRPTRSGNPSGWGSWTCE